MAEEDGSERTCDIAAGESHVREDGSQSLIDITEEDGGEDQCRGSRVDETQSYHFEGGSDVAAQRSTPTFLCALACRFAISHRLTRDCRSAVCQSALL